MLDQASRSGVADLQRAVGELHVSVKTRDGATVLDGLRQAGCLKARLPRPLVDGWMDVVTLNTSGGIAGGDRLQARFDIQRDARATIAAQAAERFYRAPPGSVPAESHTRIVVAEQAAAEWLPQETLLFDRCVMRRRLDVVMAEAATFTGVETLVFGRTAMGERVQQASVRDLIRIRRGENLLLHDAVRLEGPVDALLQHKAVAAGARAIATVLHVSPTAEARLDALRAALAAADVQCGASAWNGMLVMRIVAASAATLRSAIIAGLHILRDARPLPRVWLC